MITRIKNYLKREDITEYEIPPFEVHPGWVTFWEGRHLTSHPNADTLS